VLWGGIWASGGKDAWKGGGSWGCKNWVPVGRRLLDCGVYEEKIKREGTGWMVKKEKRK